MVVGTIVRLFASRDWNECLFRARRPQALLSNGRSQHCSRLQRQQVEHLTDRQIVLKPKNIRGPPTCPLYEERSQQRSAW